MSQELKHYGVPGMKWGVRKDKKRKKFADKATEAKKKGRHRRAAKYRAKSRSYTPGTKEHGERQGRNAVRAVSAGIFAYKAVKLFNSPAGRKLRAVGADYIRTKREVNNINNLKRKYGGIPDNAIKAGLKFAKKRFGAHNITSL